MAKLSFDDGDGVWRTIGGRRVFIREGESLSSAMKNSGKFKSAKRKSEVKDESKSFSRDELKEKYGTDNTDIINAGKEKEDRVTLKEDKKELNLSQRQKDEGNRLNTKAENGAREDVKTFLSGKEDYDGSREDFIRDLSNEWGISKEKAEEILHDENIKHPRNFTNNQQKSIETTPKNNWQEQIKANNAKMEKDVTNLQNKINEYRNRSINAKDGLEKYQLLKEADKLQNQYYERFRENERANAKIKVEEPNEKYMNVEAYAGYKDKFNDTWGKDGSSDKVVSAKMYTNDEFMEHLEDANWHSERKQLLEANLTNQELAYIKDKTKVSAWGVENLTGKEQVDKLIKEAKSQNNSISNTLRQKAYQKYLKEHPTSKITFNDFKDMMNYKK